MLKIPLSQRAMVSEALTGLGFQEIQRGMFRYGRMEKNEEFFCAWSVQEQEGSLVAVSFYTHRKARHLSFLEEDEAPENLREVVQKSGEVLKQL